MWAREAVARFRGSLSGKLEAMTSGDASLWSSSLPPRRPGVGGFVVPLCYFCRDHHHQLSHYHYVVVVVLVLVLVVVVVVVVVTVIVTATCKTTAEQ